MLKTHYSYVYICIYQKKAVPLHSISGVAPWRNQIYISRSRAVVARQAHNLKAGGSIPSSATK